MFKQSASLISIKPNYPTVRHLFFYLLTSFLAIPIIILLATRYFYLSPILPVLALVLIIIYTHPEIGLMGLICFIPYSSIGFFSEEYQFFSVYRILGVITTMAVLFTPWRTLKGKINLRSNLWIWLLLLFLIYFVSSMLSSYPEMSFNRFRKLFELYVYAWLVLVLITPKSFLKVLPLVFTYSAFLSAFISVVCYLFQFPSLFTKTADASQFYRSAGTALDPNWYSAIIIFCIPFVFYLFLCEVKFYKKAWYIFMFFVMTLAVILTYSRSGGIVLGMVLLLIFLLNLSKVKPVHLGSVFFFVLLMGLVFFLVIPSSYWQRQKSVVEKVTDSSIGRRLSYLYVGWETFKENPFFGAGPGTFPIIFSKSNYAVKYAADPEDYKRGAHNVYVEYATGVGITGLTVFLILIIVTLRNYQAAKRLFRNNGARSDKIYLIEAYELALVSQLIFFLFIGRGYSMQFWFAVALSQVAVNTAQVFARDDLKC